LINHRERKRSCCFANGGSSKLGLDASWDEAPFSSNRKKIFREESLSLEKGRGLAARGGRAAATGGVAWLWTNKGTPAEAAVWAKTCVSRAEGKKGAWAFTGGGGG